MMTSADAKTYSIGEFVDALNDVLAVGFEPGVWVTGEIDGWRPSNKHYYFQLVERADGVNATLNIALWQGVANRLLPTLSRDGVELANGLKIRIYGTIDYYAPTGRLSFKMSDIDTKFTLGDVMANREETLRKLKAEGLLETNRRLQVPLVPLRIGVVTSVGSAAWHDVLAGFESSGLAFKLTVCDTRVQGDDAVASVCAAIDTLQQRDDVDLLMVVRGGGSRTDLAAFDDERIARTIATCSKPVFVGVGHEIDISIADAVAHSSFKTPTACSEAIINLVLEFAAAVDTSALHITRLATTHVVRSNARINQLATSIRGAVATSLEKSTSLLAVAAERLKTRPINTVDRATLILEAAEARLRLLDPVTTMARGWSITRSVDGTIVTSTSNVVVGDKIVTHFADGTITSEVEKVSNG